MRMRRGLPTYRRTKEIAMCTSGSSCGCATATASTPATTSGSEGVHTTYTVAGMTCGGCAKAVTRYLTAVPGVTDVQVDVANGTVTISSGAPLDTAGVRAAVEQAGYQLVG
jgi:copper chaperone CopZ